MIDLIIRWKDKYKQIKVKSTFCFYNPIFTGNFVVNAEIVNNIKFPKKRNWKRN